MTNRVSLVAVALVAFTAGACSDALTAENVAGREGDKPSGEN